MRIEMRISLNDFGVAPARMRAAIGKGLAAAKGPLLAETNRRTPVDSGALRASERVTSDDTSLTITAGEGLPDARALYVHQGTKHMSPRPYLRDAVEAQTPAIVDAIVRAANEGLG